MLRVLAFSLALLLITSFAWGHGGEDHAPKPTPTVPTTLPELPDEASATDSGENPAAMYGVEDDSSGQGTYGIAMEDHSEHEMHADSTEEPDLFDDPLLSSTPAMNKDMGGHEMASHEQHEQHVELAEFTQVTSDAPGRNVALGITIVSGLIFGLMTLIRPFE